MPEKTKSKVTIGFSDNPILLIRILALSPYFLYVRILGFSFSLTTILVEQPGYKRVFMYKEKVGSSLIHQLFALGNIPRNKMNVDFIFKRFSFI